MKPKIRNAYVDVISVEKQKYMEVTRKPTNTKVLKFDDQEYERTKNLSI